MPPAQSIPPISIEELTTRFDASAITAIDLAVAVIAIGAGFVCGALARRATARVLVRAGGLRPNTAAIVGRLVSSVFILLGVVIAFSALGLDFGPVVTLLLLVAITAFLIGRPLLADLGAGLVLQSRRPVAVDDVIVAAGYEGVVEDIDGRVVQLRTYDGWSVRVRNIHVLDSPIVKVAERDRVRMEFVVGVAYDTDLDLAVGIARETLVAVDGVRADPAPQALVNEFDDSTINVRCWFWADPADRWVVKDAAMRSVRAAYRREGIEIAFPQRVVHSA